MVQRIRKTEATHYNKSSKTKSASPLTLKTSLKDTHICNECGKSLRDCVCNLSDGKTVKEGTLLQSGEAIVKEIMDYLEDIEYNNYKDLFKATCKYIADNFSEGELLRYAKDFLGMEGIATTESLTEDDDLTDDTSTKERVVKDGDAVVGGKDAEDVEEPKEDDLEESLTEDIPYYVQEDEVVDAGKLKRSYVKAVTGSVKEFISDVAKVTSVPEENIVSSFEEIFPGEGIVVQFKSSVPAYVMPEKMQASYANSVIDGAQNSLLKGYKVATLSGTPIEIAQFPADSKDSVEDRVILFRSNDDLLEYIKTAEWVNEHKTSLTASYKRMLDLSNGHLSKNVPTLEEFSASGATQVSNIGQYKRTASAKKEPKKGKKAINPSKTVKGYKVIKSPIFPDEYEIYLGENLVWGDKGTIEDACAWIERNA